MDEFKFEGTSLKDLADDLRAASEAVRVEIDKTVVEIGGELKEAAKKLAQPHSQRVADSIRMRIAPGYVVITAGSNELPIAELWENGNEGTHNSGRVQGVWFRHPVFGQDIWVNQRRFPFLRPALEADRRNITKRMQAAWARSLEPYRLEPEDE